MSGKVICSFSVVLMLVLMMSGPAQAGDPSLVGWWKLDDGSGTTAIDSSGYGNHGTLEGSPEWKTAGDDVKIGSGALYFDFVEGGASDYVDCGDKPEFDITDNITLALWVKSDGFRQRYQYFFSKDIGSGGYSVIRNAETRNCRVVFNGLSGQYYATGSTVIDDDQWHHLAASYDSSTGIVAFYTDGLLEVTETASGSIPTNDLMLCIGGRDVRNSNAFIDDARIYNRTLSEEEIQVVMLGGGAGFPLAMRPDPEDEAMLEATWVTLSWRPGSFAVSHDVYFGTSFDDVNEGAEGTYFGNTSVTFQAIGFPGFPAPDGLLPGTTYYWRIDEVNDANAASPWKGNVWSFSIQPNTAFNPDPANGAEFVDPNATFTWAPGFGAKLHTVYMGTNFDDVNDAAGGTPLGTASYSPGTLESEKVYYWRVDEFDGISAYKGDVWSFTTPGAVGNPQPANGAVDVQMIATLSWTPADNAASHELYFGVDADAVKNATTTSPEYIGPRALGDESYDPGRLAWDSSHYWRVDEVYPDGTVKGPVWSFATGDFFVIDDFEIYDANDNQIWYAWHDGLGYGTPGVDPYFAGNGTGAAVGDETTASYTEETIVHGGNQSMPISYDNNKQGYAYYSEVEHTLTDPRDWTEEGVTKLSLWFHGASGNEAERMFVALNGSAVVYHDDPAVTQMTGWKEWIIDLQAFADQGVNLADVNTIAIGFGTKNNPAAGGAGKMYFDDIRLYR